MDINWKNVGFFGLGIFALAAAAAAFGVVPAFVSGMLAKVGVGFTGSALKVGSFALTKAWQVALGFGAVMGAFAAAVSTLVSAVSSYFSSDISNDVSPAADKKADKKDDAATPAAAEKSKTQTAGFDASKSASNSNVKDFAAAQEARAESRVSLRN